jgi:general secretion pathway protein M
MRLLAALSDFWRGLDGRSRLWAGYVLIALLAVCLGWGALAAKTAELERKRKAREVVLKELLPLKVAYRSARLAADQMAGRQAMLRPDDTPAKILEEIGIKGKGTKIVPIKGEERAGFIDETADIRIEGLTANEVINLLYRMEKGSRPMALKKVNVRVRFDDATRFDLGMTASLLKPAQSAAK